MKLKQIRIHVLIFVALLIFSGITASFPLEGLALLNNWFPDITFISHVEEGIIQTKALHPEQLYGYDWLAFSHFAIGLYILGIYKNPLKNEWVISTTKLICVLILPIALTVGHLRQIPLYWQLIDCSFGVFGFTYMHFIQLKVNQLKLMTQ